MYSVYSVKDNTSCKPGLLSKKRDLVIMFSVSNTILLQNFNKQEIGFHICYR